MAKYIAKLRSRSQVERTILIRHRDGFGGHFEKELDYTVSEYKFEAANDTAALKAVQHEAAERDMVLVALMKNVYPE